MTPREAQHFRRSSDLPWYWQIVHFLFAFLVDGWYGISLTRLLAIYFGKMAVDVSVETKHISGNAVIVIIFCLAAAFGKGVFQLALSRWRGTSSSTDATVDITEKLTVFTQESGHAFAVADPEKG